MHQMANVGTQVAAGMPGLGNPFGTKQHLSDFTTRGARARTIQRLEGARMEERRA